VHAQQSFLSDGRDELASACEYAAAREAAGAGGGSKPYESRVTWFEHDDGVEHSAETREIIGSA
jgi:hypothetical protein